jgi:Probable zinc-ribbon domain
MEMFVDIAIECVRCAVAFTWAAGEQSFFARHTPPLARPKLCKACRARKKAQRAHDEAQRTAAPALTYDVTKAQEVETAPRTAPVAEKR